MSQSDVAYPTPIAFPRRVVRLFTLPWRPIPIGTGCMMLLLGAAFAWQSLGPVGLVGGPTDTLRLIDLGANAPVLVRHGAWFRLVTANLLHLTPREAGRDALVLLLVGITVERIVGLGRFLILLLGTAILAQVASVCGGLWLKTPLLSAGMSGGLLGLMVAVGSICWRFPAVGRRRWAALRWSVAVAIYTVAFLTVAFMGPDWPGLAGGAAAGLVLASLLCLGCRDRADLRRGAWTSQAAAMLVVIWGGSIAAAIWQMTRPASRGADEAVLAAAMLDRPGTDATQENTLAWAIAIDPGAAPALLRQGADLAARALASAVRADPKSVAVSESTDTLAALEYRGGDAATAARRELPLIWSNPVMAGHYALFLDRRLRENGVQVLGEGASAAPAIALVDNMIRLSHAEATREGARVYAVLRRGESVAGLLMFEIPPDFSGSQVLPLPWASGAPSTSPPPALWTDPATKIHIALFDRSGCYCQAANMGPFFRPVTPASALPP